MGIGDRIRFLRKELGLNQTEFAQRLLITQSGIAANERGSRGVDDRTIKLICSEYGVSETWLRTGEGEMNEKKPNDLIDRLAQEYQMSATGVALLETYLKLSPEMRTALDVLFDKAIEARADRLRAEDRALAAELYAEHHSDEAPDNLPKDA